MDKKEFAAKFKDPRWQKVRLLVFERDQFMCRKCGDKDSTLNVHHCYYEWGNDPWDYPIQSLVTLCEGCHEAETVYSSEVKKELWKQFAKYGVLTDEINRIAMNFSWAVRRCKGNAMLVANAIAHVMFDDEVWNVALEAVERSYAKGAEHNPDYWKHGDGGPIDYLLHKVPEPWELEADAHDARKAAEAESKKL